MDNKDTRMSMRWKLSHEAKTSVPRSKDTSGTLTQKFGSNQDLSELAGWANWDRVALNPNGSDGRPFQKVSHYRTSPI